VIPATITEIDEYAFFCATCIRSVTLPSTLQKVGANAFLWAGVEKLTIAEGVTHLGESAFRGCPIKTVTIPSTLQTAETYALWSSSLVELINNSTIEFTTGDSGIISNSTKVYTGESKLVKQGDYLFATFDGVNYLVGYEGTQKNVTLPESYNGQSYEIYRYAFYEKDLRSVNIGNGVTKIGEGAFSWCLGLSVLVIGDNVTEIGANAFYNCSLASITLGKSVTTIGKDAFDPYYNPKLYELINLSSLDIKKQNLWEWESKYGDLPAPGILHNGESVLVNQDGFLFISMNTNGSVCSFDKADYHTLVAYVGEATEITLPESYNGAEYELGARCFRGVSFTKVVVPDAVSEIHGNVFKDCKYLQSVVMSKKVEMISDGMIHYNNDFVATIVYYEGTKEEWATARGTETPHDMHTVAFYSQTEPTTDGNYWYYDENNIPVLW
jgi:hypothetical protein